MSESPIQLENILNAVEVRENFYKIKASDGKTYLCEQIFSWGRGVEGRGSAYITNEEKEITKKAFIRQLSEQDIKPDIIEVIDSDVRKNNFLSQDSFLARYTLNGYKIIKEFS